MMYNKSRHFAACGRSDAHQGSRACAQRYMSMKYIFIITCFFVSSKAMALKPGNCDTALENLFANLVIKNKLGQPTHLEPNENYKHKKHPNICVIQGSVSGNGQWLVHKHKNGVDVIFQLTSFKPFSKSYYGPFQSAYNK